MRFKLILSVKPESFGNVLPVSYQYELSSCIHRKLTDNMGLYVEWLQQNGFISDLSSRYRLFSISNFYIPRIKVEVDRLCILARRVQLWISFLPVRGTRELVEQIFLGQDLLIGDRHSKVEFVVDEIMEIEDPDYKQTMDYLSLSPIVFANVRPNRSIEYIGPDSPEYQDILLDTILEKYEYFYRKEFPHNLQFGFELITPPKRKGIFIKRFTPDETKIIGYMYKFRLTLHPTLHRLIYNTGLGEKINLGFGCVEVLK
ncbi:CRISPR-associated endoribonuclease Cas6 [Coprobacter secundus]|nr:CRISPR-associated endoribonuclease Cas6 [Coprobacter secundus]KHM47927.1 CRISPR-associated protein Cas6 [Coprobacter secundus]